MKKPANYFIIAAMMLLTASCVKETIHGMGPLVTEQRTLGNFTAIDLSLNATILYTEGDSFKVELLAQQNVLNEIITEVHNNKLDIRLPWDTKLFSYTPITINITAPAVSDFNISGSGLIQSSDTLHVSNADLNISGDGDITLAYVVTNDIDARISGSGKVQVNGGSSTGVSTTISGSGNIDLVGISAKTAKVNTSGSGVTKLNVANDLDVFISGTGRVYYMGNPVISAQITGGGKLIHL